MKTSFVIKKYFIWARKSIKTGFAVIP